MSASMSQVTIGGRFLLSVGLLFIAVTVQAMTLHVNCGQAGGLNSIGAAVRVVQTSEEQRSATILVSGACKENVVIQSMDRLTLTAVNGASVTDASRGTLDVISIQDSREVAINGFTVNAGAGVNANGVSCGEYSLCRLSGNVIQGAGLGGFGVFGVSQATLDGDTLLSNGFGLVVRNGSSVRAGGQFRPITSRANGQGINIARDASVNLGVVIESNTDQGVVAQFHSTLLLTGSISSNASVGAHVREGSVARFTNATITGNGGPGVLIHDLSMVTFNGTTVTGNNHGGFDVVCNPQFPATREVGSTGGTTNCVEP